MIKLQWLVLLAVLALGAGCSSVYDARKAMSEGGYQKVMTDTQDINQFPERDRTLVLNYRAHAKMGLGYWQSARDDYLRAWNAMNLSEGGGVAAAHWFSERQKFWMGDPYERMFNSWYLGMMYFMLGDRENSMACFRNALYVDTGDLKQGEYAADWLPTFIMRIRAYLARQDEAGAKAMLDELKRLPKEPANFDASCPWLNMDAQKDANTIMMLELGVGPFFTAEGHHGSTRVINQGEYRESFVEVLVNGETLGRAYKIGDTFFQAITRGGRVMDDILKGKAIAKTASIAAGASAMHIGRMLVVHGKGKGTKTAGAIAMGVGAAVMVAGLLANAEADTRGNVLLPGETHLMMAKLPPGEHKVELRFFDSNGRELANLRQRDIPLRVPETGDAVLLARSQPRYIVPRTLEEARMNPLPATPVKQ
ncbi:MAG: hypothetical protein KF696_16070 [Planctomycetes bacterium]|nr:hypothetical protein [Planctomycetota bacterium]MCW8137251.1 hypothetical protein [Planctomycetota bacterium]